MGLDRSLVRVWQIYGIDYVPITKSRFFRFVRMVDNLPQFLYILQNINYLWFSIFLLEETVAPSDFKRFRKKDELLISPQE
jgi:hypothetical protein